MAANEVQTVILHRAAATQPDRRPVAEFVRLSTFRPSTTEFSRTQLHFTRRPILHFISVLSAILLLLTFSLASRVSADTEAPAAPGSETDPAIKSGGNALRSDNRFPWYDAEHDELQPVALRRFDDDGKNDSDDEKSSTARHPRHSSRNRDSSDNNSPNTSESSSRDEPPPSPEPNMPEISAPWLIWVAWIVIGGVLAFLAVMLIRAFLNREARKAKSSDGDSIEAEDDGDRRDALPLPATKVRKGTLLDEARRSFEAGDYNAAIVYLYGYQLFRLDQNQWIRLAKGKTNREYLRELSGRGELQGVLARTMVPFEDVYFGDHPLDRARFEACWNEVERFDRLIERAAT